MTTAAHKAAWLKKHIKPGEIYAGLLLGENGAPDQHLVLLAGEAEALDWKAAIAWAKKQGGELPTRREQSLLFTNAKAHFKPTWYWSGEKHAAASGYAWCQYFGDGYQSLSHTDYQLRARAVLRIPLSNSSL